MFQGRPCKDMSVLNEYFPHGITNGASWYNVPGNDHGLTAWVFCSLGCCCLLMIFSSCEKELLFCFFKKLKWFKTLQQHFQLFCSWCPLSYIDILHCSLTSVQIFTFKSLWIFHVLMGRLQYNEFLMKIQHVNSPMSYYYFWVIAETR